jgi:hypothetical protein
MKIIYLPAIEGLREESSFLVDDDGSFMQTLTETQVKQLIREDVPLERNGYTPKNED